MSSTRFVFALCFVAVLVCTTVCAFAGINDTWDWKGSKRKLKVWVNPADADKEFGGKKLKDIVKEAMDNWNGVKGDTGWEFEEGTKDSHDIEVKTGESGGGGAHTTFDGIDKSREVSKRSIVIDPNFKKGWGFNDQDKKNPLGTMKHELSHTLRLTHQGGTRSKTGKIKDPQGSDTKDDDVTTISEDDKKEAKKSSTAPIRKAQAPVGPQVVARYRVQSTPLLLRPPGWYVEGPHAVWRNLFAGHGKRRPAHAGARGVHELRRPFGQRIIPLHLGDTRP